MAGSAFTMAMWAVTGIMNSLLTVGAIIVLTIVGAVSPGSPVLSCSSASLISARLLVLLLVTGPCNYPDCHYAKKVLNQDMFVASGRKLGLFQLFSQPIHHHVGQSTFTRVLLTPVS